MQKQVTPRFKQKQTTATSKGVTPVTAYDRGRSEIVSATAIDDVKRIRDKAEALRRYNQQAGDKHMAAAMAAIKLRACYQIGVISSGLGKRPGTRTDLTSPADRDRFKLAILKDAGIDSQRASEYEGLIRLVTVDEIEEYCRSAAESGDAPPKSAVAYLRQAIDDRLKAEFRKNKHKLPANLYVGDFRENASAIPDASADLVFTDPPYDRESIPLYDAAAAEAARILKPGGSMITYCGHIILPQVIPLMQRSLIYYWIGADVHEGGLQLARMNQFGIIVGFKPLLWFVKEYRADRQAFICDTVISPREKDSHLWQQALMTAEHFIGGLTPADGVVVDFFAGGGTTIVAAANQSRKWIAFEKDEAAVAAIMRRIGSHVRAGQPQ